MRTSHHRHAAPRKLNPRDGYLNPHLPADLLQQPPLFNPDYGC
jgi:hypothetical protein